MEQIGIYRELLLKRWPKLVKYLADSDESLRPMLEYHFETSGKLIRPSLTLAFYALLKGLSPEEIPESHYDIAFAVEVLHNATLVHDDLQDGDEYRRNRPTVWKEFGAYQAINAGSALYFLAQRLLVESSEVPVKTRLQLLDQLSYWTLKIIAGQAAEKMVWENLKLEGKELTTPLERAEEFYISTVQKKTSALFAIPFQFAATLAEKGEEFSQWAAGVAQPLGAIFQIQDDLLDLFGNKGRGDSVGNDIAEGKPSLPALYALYLSGPEDRLKFFQILQKERSLTTEEEVRWAIELIKSSGALAKSLQFIKALESDVMELSAKYSGDYPSLSRFIESVCQYILKPIAHLF